LPVVGLAVLEHQVQVLVNRAEVGIFTILQFLSDLEI
jgi:hypothetical protein